MIFYTGTHVLSHAKTLERSFISVNLLRKRRSDFTANNWILDSGAFTEISTYGQYRTSVFEYSCQINRWAKCGNLELAVSQDYMCEPFILQKTGLTIKDHQLLTVKRYIELVTQPQLNATIMPVLQGYAPDDYLRCVEIYGDLLKKDIRVGVGSVCKRNGNPQSIVAVLECIKRERPDLRLHGFGLKYTSLRNNYITSLLYSADSLAWSYAARRQGQNRNGLKEAQDFTDKINTNSGKKGHQFIYKGIY